MPTFNLILDDGDMPGGGQHQVSAVVDTTTVTVIAINFYNTSPTKSADFAITNTKGQTRSVHLPPNTGSPAAPASITPPFSPGNWTPTVVANTSGSGPPYQSDGTWSLSFVGASG